MNYSKIQKFLSSLIIFSLLFSTTFQIPFLQFSTYASSKEFYNIVAIVVEDEIYSDIKDKVLRYSEDIQGVLENTKVVILPTPSNTPAFKIASMLESLYFDGYNGLTGVDFESKLIGTVLIGNLSIPEVFKGEDSSNTILPYTDFIDKKYIYNNNTNKYEENSDNIEGIKSEIWHGIISPNEGNENDNINAINDYFDKNHDFYKGTGNFKYSDGIINGNNSVGVKSDYEPYVFYFDNLDENKSLNFDSYKSYLAYINNKEDIVYDRFTKELATKITNKILGDQTATVSELINKVDPNFDVSGISNIPDTSLTPDIQTRNIIKETTKMFIQAFSEGTIGEFRSDVHNAGRYNGKGNKVNVDFVPYLITVLDLVNDEIIKKSNTLIEDKIDNVVKTDLQKNVYISDIIYESNYINTSVKNSGDNLYSGIGNTNSTFSNILYGTQAKDIITPEQCSIFRGNSIGGGKLIEANRAYDYFTTEGDVEKLTQESISCLKGIQDKSSLIGYWGNNSVLNSNFSGGIPVLGEHNLNSSIVPLFNINGTIDVTNKVGIYPNKPVLNSAQSYEDCEKNNFILSYREKYDNEGNYYLDYRIPINGQQKYNWSCKTDNKIQIYNKTYEQLLSEKRIWNELDGEGGYIQHEEPKCNGLVCIDNNYKIIFKEIPSFIEHKSPTLEELDSQMKNMVSSSLPIDKDRYIDFKGVSGYQKIHYPYLFRLGIKSGQELNISNIKNNLKEELDNYNNIINTNLYDYLNNQNKISGVNGSYLDNLSFAIYWNNLGISGKYKFVFENYLSDQSGGNDLNFGLAKNKNSYEIAYLGSKGDASNMYVLLDPNSKDTNPYADIISKNQSLKSSLMGFNMNETKQESNEGTSKCAPPEGVPLWQWFPAIMCRIKNLLPPTISISTSSCSSNSSLLSEDDLREIFENGGDKDKNGIIDCLELKLAGGSLGLTSDASKYYYGSIGKLKSQIKDKNGNVVTLDSFTNINFELVKVYVPKVKEKEFSISNRELIYDKTKIEGSNLNNKQVLEKLKSYIDFTPGKVRVKYGTAEKSFVVKNKDADFVFKASYEVENFNKKVEIFEESQDLNISSRGDRMFASSYKISTNEDGTRLIDNGINNVLVSDNDNIFISNINNFSTDLLTGVDSKSSAKEKLVLNLINFDSSGNKIKLDYPIKIDILRNGEKILKESDIINNFNGIISLGSFKKSGSYEFIISDNFGYTFKKQIEILPERASKIKINNSTSIIETGGNIITNVFTIYDKYDNVANGDFYKIDLAISGKGLSFESDNKLQLKNKEFSIYDGYKIFKLISTDKQDTNDISFIVRDYNQKELFRETKQIKTVEKIYPVIQPLFTKIDIGGGEYSYNLSFRNIDGNILEDFNSRVYLNIPVIYGNSTKDYFDVINGKTNISFVTKNISGKDIPIELQIEGISGIIKRNIIINPGKAVMMDQYLSSENIEATNTSFANLRVELKDRYGNLVFNDSYTKANLEILDKYSNIINSNVKTTNFNEGIAYFKFNASLNPGIAYYKISTDQSLDNNSFEINSNNGNLIINGVGEIAGQIQTSYFWNKEKIDGKKYNAIYTTLLGSNYGDVSQKNYLAGSLLFDKNNRALGVTSLLNNPYKTNDITNIYPNGNIKNLSSSADLSQDIQLYVSSIDDKISLNIYNKALNNYIGNIFYNFDNNTELNICENGLENCSFNKTKTSIFAQSLSNDFYTKIDNDNIIFYDKFNKKIFSINKNGKINKFTNLDFNINIDNNKDYLLIDINIAGKSIGNIGFNFINNVINISRDENIFNNKINSLKNSILVLLNSNLYSSKNVLNNKIIYYNDPFSSDNKINEFVDSNIDSYENFIDKGGLGWNEGNKTLLEFSAGKSIGESVKDYMSFGVINLGDPVISLKKIKEKLPNTNVLRKFDSTVGKLISNNSKVKSYEVFDYNNDQKDDILLIKSDGFLELLENKDIEGNFLNKGNLLNIIDLGSSDLLKTGDFTGDNYDDIFFVNNKGDAYLINNNKKDFNRINLKDEFNLDGKIIISRVFDMDNDGISDIITLDDNGKINIFYGGGTGEKPIFTKKLISDKNGLLLGNSIRNDNGLIYYDGLYQLQKTGDNSKLLLNSKTYLNNEANNLANINQADFSFDVIDNLIFEKLNYNKNNSIKKYSVDDFTNLQEINSQDLTNYNTNSDEYTTFIKSEYSESSGIKVEKKFVDINLGNLKSGDMIEVNITLTNTNNIKIKNIAYGERLNNIFTLDKSSIKVDKDYNLNFNIATLTFLIDSFDLLPGESINIKYNAKTKAINYGYINVGLFEDAELGNDEFGDIILSKNNQNCSETVNIFRSTQKREYEEGVKTPECSETKNKLPDAIIKNSLDENSNGIPDYIDLLSNPDNLENLKEFSNGMLAEFNDSNVYDDSGTVEETINSALDTADNIIEGISCGFGTASCISTPLNWAPLAPGGDPTMFGKPIGDGLKIDEGLPIFSALTWIWYGTVCGPIVWPPSPLTMGCSGLGAGGFLGVNNTSNFFRLFITPTLTGGVGTAICLGGPASVAGKTNPKGLSPITPGGNCIVLAKPLASCSADGSDGDIGSTGFSNVNSSSFGLINGNCDSTKIKQNSILEQSLVDDYYDYRKTGVKSNNLNSRLESTYTQISRGETIVNNTPFIQLGSGGEGGEINVSINFEGSPGGNFSDIVQINKSRIFGFPQFLMEWITMQVEEIANKLTDFPTIFIILPDFTGIFGSDWAKNSGNTGKGDDLFKINDSFSKKLDSTKIGKNVNSGVKTTSSGIKAAYDFMSNFPLVKFEKEVVNINFPWIDKESIDRTVADRGITVNNRNKEISDFKDSFSLGATCSQIDQKEKEKCIKQNEISSKIIIDAQALVSSLERNIEILEEYKKMPEKIYNWLNVKERYLEQILCNVESISKMMGGRISINGKRFKAWVNLYILIKAVLKSWQGLIDIFTNYESECHECKNERGDLMTFIWGLISVIIPKIPVIQFPKWPDIIIDLHNIRAGLTINLPEINISDRPILLPYLPELKLPRLPNISVSLPELPILPIIELPELPDLPSLPTIELPDLPPPPTLPSLLFQLQGILNILKLITKMMCILKKSPFVPEWRAGDQIAFLTERQGYLGIDFLVGLSMPQFSFPFVDAIKVTSYVNLEFETDFIVELTKQAAVPINNFTNNFINLFNFSISDIDLSGNTPNDININIGVDGNISGEVGLNKIIDKKELLTLILIKNFKKLFNYISDNSSDQISMEEFQKNINSQISSEDFIKDPKTKSIRKIWDDLNNYSYSTENTLINNLQKNNSNKFDLVKDIINTEVVKNKNIIKKIDNDFKNDTKKSLIKVSLEDNNSDIDFYNSKLDLYNKNLLDASKKLINNNETELIKKELKDISNYTLAKIKGGLNSFNQGENKKILSYVNQPTTGNSTYSGIQTNTGNLASTNGTETNIGIQTETSCQKQAKSDYKYDYKGLYIIEKNTSYRLFDYLNELDGKEKTTIIDFDNDGDEDLLYMTNGNIFLKENLENKDNKIYVSTKPIVLNSSDNKFLNDNKFYEAINNFKSTISESNFINFSFKNSNNKNINNYRIELYNIVDKFSNVDNTSYEPNNIRKSIIDSFSSIDNLTIDKEENDSFIFRKNLGFIDKIGNPNGLILKTYDFKNIKNDIIDNKIVTLKSGTILYAGKENTIIKYFEEGDDINEQNLKTTTINKYSNIEIKNGIKIQSLNGDAYINTNNLINILGNNILKYIGLPLLTGTEILDSSDSYNGIHPRYIEIKYYDGSAINLDFSKVKDYTLYNLGINQNESYIRLSRENDYLYAKIRGFNNNIFSTISNQVVIYPQVEADTNSPELSLSSVIKIPVYQKKTIDLTSDIFEDSGIKNISELFVDFDLEVDSDLDGDTKNDRDTKNIKIIKDSNSIKIEFGKFDSLINKKIGIGLVDNNGNTSFKEINFLVYSPIPNIKNYSDGLITGNTNENLEEEPINLYRYRGGMIQKLKNLDGKDFVNTTSGNYEFKSKQTDNGLNIYNNDKIIAYINENTGLIEIKDFNSKINVIASNNKLNDVIYPKIVLSNNIKDIYYEYIQLPGNSNIYLIDDFNEINKLSDKGIYIQFIDKSSYNYYKIPDSSKFNPGVFSIYRNSDLEKQELFTIFRDGRVNTISDYYTLEYFEYKGNIGYKLIDKHFNNEIARILLKIEGDYIIK